MKNLVVVSALLAAPITFAGGMGNSAYQDMLDRAQSGTSVESADLGSSEAPENILESREVTGSENDNYIKYSFSSIPKSYWEKQTGVDLGDSNGFVELEEYFGETERQTYTSGEDVSREAERQERAKNKALRLRSLYQ